MRPLNGCCLGDILRKLFYYCQFWSSWNVLFTFGKMIFQFVPYISCYSLGTYVGKFHCLNIQTVEFTDIKNFSLNLVRETQKIGFYADQFFLLGTTNIFRSIYLFVFYSCTYFRIVQRSLSSEQAIIRQGAGQLWNWSLFSEMAEVSLFSVPSKPTLVPAQPI